MVCAAMQAFRHQPVVSITLFHLSPCPSREKIVSSLSWTVQSSQIWAGAQCSDLKYPCMGNTEGQAGHEALLGITPLTRDPKGLGADLSGGFSVSVETSLFP